MIVKLAEKLGATRMDITEGFRTRAEFYSLYDKEKDMTKYLRNQHYKQNAADVTYFKNNIRIDKFTAAKTAAQIKGINGIGTYDNMDIVHIDIRDEQSHWYRNNGTDITVDYKKDSSESILAKKGDN